MRIKNKTSAKSMKNRNISRNKFFLFVLVFKPRIDCNRSGFKKIIKSFSIFSKINSKFIRNSKNNMAMLTSE